MKWSKVPQILRDELHERRCECYSELSNLVFEKKLLLTPDISSSQLHENCSSQESECNITFFRVPPWNIIPRTMLEPSTTLLDRAKPPSKFGCELRNSRLIRLQESFANVSCSQHRLHAHVTRAHTHTVMQLEIWVDPIVIVSCLHMLNCVEMCVCQYRLKLKSLMTFYTERCVTNFAPPVANRIHNWSLHITQSWNRWFRKVNIWLRRVQWRIVRCMKYLLITPIKASRVKGRFAWRRWKIVVRGRWTDCRWWHIRMSWGPMIMYVMSSSSIIQPISLHSSVKTTEDESLVITDLQYEFLLNLSLNFWANNYGFSLHLHGHGHAASVRPHERYLPLYQSVPVCSASSIYFSFEELFIKHRQLRVCCEARNNRDERPALNQSCFVFWTLPAMTGLSRLLLSVQSGQDSGFKHFVSIVQTISITLIKSRRAAVKYLPHSMRRNKLAPDCSQSSR